MIYQEEEKVTNTILMADIFCEKNMVKSFIKVNLTDNKNDIILICFNRYFIQYVF